MTLGITSMTPALYSALAPAGQHAGAVISTGDGGARAYSWCLLVIVR